MAKIPLQGPPVWKAYLFAGISLLPATLFTGFAMIFLQPRLDKYLFEANIYNPRIEQIVQFPNHVVSQGKLLLIGFVLLFVGAELWSRSWPKTRTLILSIAVFALNFAAFTYLTAIYIAALLPAVL